MPDSCDFCFTVPSFSIHRIQEVHETLIHVLWGSGASGARRRGRRRMNAACPVPDGRHDRIVLGHGSGGRLGQSLLEQVFLPHFSGQTLARLEGPSRARLGHDGGRTAGLHD